MAFGDIRSKEVQATQEKDQQAASIQVSADVLDDQVQQTPAASRQSGSAALERGSAAPAPRQSGSAALKRGSAAPAGVAATSNLFHHLQDLIRSQSLKKEMLKNLHMSKVKMERPSHSLNTRRVVTTKSQVLFISKFYSFVPCVAT
jgi:hypothetical protein